MDASLIGNLFALALSAVALVTSVVTARRQLLLAHNSNVLPVIIEMFKDTRQAEFQKAIEYVGNRLAAEHGPDNGYRNLPPEPKGHIRRIGLFYDDVGKLVAHDVVDERLVIGAYGSNVVRMWEVLAPYVYSERRRGAKSMLYFEDLAARAKATSMEEVHAAIGLNRYPPAATG